LHEDQQVHQESRSKHLAALKIKWDGLPETERQDLAARLEGERSVIDFLKSAGGQQDYKPINYYACFLKDQIMKDSQSKDFKVNKRYFKQKFNEVWNGTMTEEDRKQYRGGGRDCT